MSIRNLHHLLEAASVVVVGASDRAGSVGATVWHNISTGGFAGQLWPVNRRHERVGGQVAYRSIDAIPAVPELAVICTPAAGVPALIVELGRAGCRAAVVISAGLDASGEDGRPIRLAMLEAARPFLMRILGPNCVGLLVPRLGLNASFAPANALPGRLAFVAQSGALVTAVLDWAAGQRIGFSCFISLGDGSDVDLGDLLDYLAADVHTEAILIYAEGIRQARKFMSAARGAARSKPTVIVKAGRSATAAHAAFSHTGALAGADLVYDAALRRAGMLRVFSTAELFDAVTVLSQRRRPRGERLAILTNGGGPGVMAADALDAGGGNLAPLSPATMARLDACLPPTWSHGNPVDIIGDAPLQRYHDALQVLLAAPEVDAVLLIHAPTAIVGSDDIANAVAPLIAGEAAAQCPVYTCWMGGDSVAAARRRFSAAGLPHFDTPEAAVSAYLQVIHYGQNQQLLMQAPDARESAAPIDNGAAAALVARLGAGPVGEADTKALLALYGIEVAAGVIVPDADAAIAAAQKIGYPVALKLASPDITHKSDLGGVALDLEDAEALRKALHSMAARVRQLRPQVRIDGYAVQKMIRRSEATELIVGLSTDPVFGPVVLFGQGGVAVELLSDKTVGLPPLNRVLAADMVGRTRVARLLAGFRGRPPADLDAICDVLIRVGQLAADLPRIVELDINPLLADAQGVIALDARMRLAEPAMPGSGLDRFAILPYPGALERRIDSAVGPLTVRPIRPEDAAAHTAFFASLSAEDVQMRMFGAMRALSTPQLARFTQIDYAREMALLATRGGANGTPETLGVARVVFDPDMIEGEFAIIVRSDLKHRGLGGMLFDCLLDYCRQQGVQVIKGQTLPQNTAMQALAASRGFTLSRTMDGCVAMSLPVARKL